MAESIKGLKALLKKLDNLDKDLFDKIEGVVDGHAHQMATRAKRYAPKNTGHTGQTIAVAQGIKREKGVIDRSVIANAPYALYIEFGTGKQVKIEPEMREVAARARAAAKKGSFADGLKSIERWLKLNGGDPKNAYIVLVSILKRGLKPQPFLYPALVDQRPLFIRDMERLIKKELGRI